ncbi:unnamed protein product [Parascedosporium putredinis]|uniref:Uncharacterized protein n=1 Tax=Parascedosporium putredinis TaxID=1442378 RepID=A0A9P1GXS0_9PEZI|nr:unnamed protein product [Parascedosporium putredinis]CAI7989296.1 unnamed protein product [Parascedosporium putredinis]
MCFYEVAHISPETHATPIITTTAAQATAAAAPVPASASQPEVARALPAKDSITSDTIEQAYETFRTPPKSGGKSFDTFLLYQLIQKLESKELKTWAELALKLGVEPPDQEKGESSQKIQQYAVRLKRWMHSMHVDAFFEYLMGRPHHPYWSEVTPDPALSEQGKDGVAPEDDMALRALLPHIRPKRGRKREADGGRSPSQRPRLETPRPR